MSGAATCHPKQRVDVEVRLELHRPNPCSCADADSDFNANTQNKAQVVSDHIPHDNQLNDCNLTFDPNHSAIIELHSAVTTFIRTFPLLIDALHDAPPTIASIQVPACTRPSSHQTMQSNQDQGKDHPDKSHFSASRFDGTYNHPKPTSPTFHAPCWRTHPTSHLRPIRDNFACSIGERQQMYAPEQGFLYATKIRVCTPDAEDEAFNMQDATASTAENASLYESQRTVGFHSRRNRSVLFMRADIHIHIYHARSSTELVQIPEPLDSLAVPYAIPHHLDDNLWYSLAFGPAHKRTLAHYISIRRLLYSRQVDRCVIPSSGFVLLYGPPGTGKTTLCRAVATHFAIRHGLSGVFLHVRMDRLVSKWLGESAKLVASLFEAIIQCAKTHPIVFLLLDEVESIARARSHTQAITKSSGDEVRVVNALLAALDETAQYSNVVVMATSNLLNDIDEAVVDRADIRLHVDVPNVSVIGHLVLDCVKQLAETGIIDAGEDRDFGYLTATNAHEFPSWLQETCMHMEGLSARQLRKLSVVALTLSTYVDDQRGVKLAEFVRCLVQAKRLCAIQGDAN